MEKIKKRIEIVRSSTSGLSSMSRTSCDAISAVLAKNFENVGVTVVDNLLDLEALVNRAPDLVFLGMKFIPKDFATGLVEDNKIWLSEYLAEHGIACTGSAQMAYELERDKPLAKQRVLDAGLSTSPFCVIKCDQLLDIGDLHLTFPLFVKPTNRGGGSGIDSGSVVYNIEELNARVRSIATELQADSLVEEYLPGREFSVAILKEEHSTEFLVMPIELVAPPDKAGVRMLSSKVKSSNTEQVLAVTDESMRAKVVRLALEVFCALGARDYGRIDVRLDAFGIPNFLEANLIPSLISGYGSFPKACVLNIGLEFESMIMRIARLGLDSVVHGVDDVLEPIPLLDVGGRDLITAQAVLELA
jgi:D-alanine-D-alanine ligase